MSGRRDASGVNSPVVCRACGREQTGQDPNVVARKYLGALVGKRVDVKINATWAVTGILRRFDNYCLVIGFHDQEDVIVFKGPGVMVGPAK